MRKEMRVSREREEEMMRKEMRERGEKGGASAQQQ